MVHVFGDERFYFQLETAVPVSAGNANHQDRSHSNIINNNNINNNNNNSNGNGATSSSHINNNVACDNVDESIFPPCPCAPIHSTPTSSSSASATSVSWNSNDNVRSSKLLRRCTHDGQPTKVLLYPEEGWARSATNSYWLITIPWWNRNKCKVVEVAGTRRNSTQGKVVDTGSKGTVYIVGTFKNSSEPDFKLTLTRHISAADFNLGYLMTGTLERGPAGKASLQLTHFAVVRRYENFHN